MLRVLLLLLGTGYVRRGWRVHVVLGALLVSLAVFLLADAWDGMLVFPLRLFGAVLLAEGLLTLVAGFVTSGIRRRIVLARGALITVSAVLVVIGGTTADILVSIAFGIAFAVDGMTCASPRRTSSASPASALAMLGGVAELALGVLLIEPTVHPVRRDDRDRHRAPDAAGRLGAGPPRLDAARSRPTAAFCRRCSRVAGCRSTSRARRCLERRRVGGRADRPRVDRVRAPSRTPRRCR